jgi:protein regulator of cytokinesis 1
MTPRTQERKKSLNNTGASFTPLLTPNQGGNVVLLSPSRTITETLNTLAASTAKELEQVWDEVGYSPEERASQLSDLLLKFRDLCEAKIAEEKGVAETFRQTISESKDEIQRLSKALKSDINLETLMNPSDLTLTDELDRLDSVLEGLRAQAKIAQEELKECRDFLIDAYDALGLELEPSWRDIESDLTSTRRQAFLEKRSEMKEELASRTAAVIQLVRDCQHLMHILHIDGENGSEVDRRIAGSVVRSKDDSFIMASRFRSETCVGISSTAIEELTQRMSELHGEKRRRQNYLHEVGAEISMLWEKLEVSEEEQIAFTKSVQGLSLETLKKGEEELKRLSEIKSRMLGKLIHDVRSEIRELWELTNAAPAYCASFEPMKVESEDLFDDALLEKHEIYKRVLEDRLEEMRPILRLIERREAIVKERMEYENLQKDPDRLKQRGAALTKQLMEEEKMAKRIKRDLPRLTEILEGKLSDWKEKHGEHFKYSGKSYLDIMDEQEREWEDYKEQKHQRMLIKKQEEKALGESRFVGKKKGRQPLNNAQNKGNGAHRLRGKSRDPNKLASGRHVVDQASSTNL